MVYSNDYRFKPSGVKAKEKKGSISINDVELKRYDVVTSG